MTREGKFEKLRKEGKMTMRACSLQYNIPTPCIQKAIEDGLLPATRDGRFVLVDIDRAKEIANEYHTRKETKEDNRKGRASRSSAYGRCVAQFIDSLGGAFDKEGRNDIVRSYLLGEERSKLAKTYGCSVQAVDHTLQQAEKILRDKVQTAQKENEARDEETRSLYAIILKQRAHIHELLQHRQDPKHTVPPLNVKVGGENVKVLLTAVDREIFSHRVYNTLNENGIKTVYDLVQKSGDDLRALPKIGAGSLGEVDRYLAKNGLRLGMDGLDIVRWTARV